MSDAPAASGFSPRVILALVAVGVIAFAGLAVLSAYAPDLRGGGDARGHALSPSAIGFKGAVVMLKAMDVPVTVSRSKPGRGVDGSLLVLTPELATTARDLAPFARSPTQLIILPKWRPMADPARPGFVSKNGTIETTQDATALLKAYAPRTVIARRPGPGRPQLHGGQAIFAAGTWLPLGPIDQLQTLAGEGWTPALLDERGQTVLAVSKTRPGVWVLADPDLLNTQGLKNLDTARAGMMILQTLRGDRGVRVDVTLSGYVRGRGLMRMLLEPPWLSATLCAVAAMLLMGLHGLARFGPTRRRSRDLALGASALVDNSAGLVRLARREAEFATPYASLIFDRVARRTGGDPVRLAEMAHLSGVETPQTLSVKAGKARTRDDLLSVGQRLHQWKREVTRGHH